MRIKIIEPSGFTSDLALKYTTAGMYDVRCWYYGKMGYYMPSQSWEQKDMNGADILRQIDFAKANGATVKAWNDSGKDFDLRKMVI